MLLRADRAVFATEPEPRHADTGEQRLLAALLALAIADARKGRFGARSWLASDAPSAGPGWSFVEVCALLGCDPAWVRAEAARGTTRRLVMRRTRRLRAAA